jgi:hypothetical protein
VDFALRDTDQGVHDVCLEILAKKEDLAEDADKRRDTSPVRLRRDSRKMEEIDFN